ncbi:MAG: Eco57I restriction-modification methylase domain-containing protein, partial [Chloroflexaceae bacterium]
MTTSDTTRKGIINQGAFFSPYYLFDLLGRRHADELDPEGRDINRRLLRQVFRKAWRQYGETGSTPGEAWQAWLRELFEALGFRLQHLPAPVETTHHGVVPISRAAFAEGDDAADGSAPLVFVDVHGFGTDLDRARYPHSGQGTPDGYITEETIARAIEFALDANETRWAIVAAGETLRLYRKGGSVARQYLEINVPALFDGDRADEWTAFWGLFRFPAFVPDPAGGKCLLDRVLEESQRHAARIADDLRENVVVAVEALIQGVLDDPANADLMRNNVMRNNVMRKDDDDHALHSTDYAVRIPLHALFEEALYFLYRLLFVLYAESRDLLPTSEPIYRDTYSLEHLRDMAERPLHAEDADKTYYIQTLRTLFGMMHRGFPEPAAPLKAPFSIPAYDGQLFDPQRTQMIDQCRIPDRALQQVIRELSLSRPKRRSDRRERYSYADLGVDQLGSIYEGLLVYEPAIVDAETVVAKVKGEERLISRAQAEEYDLPFDPDTLRRRGAFVLRLWGGRRKGSGSYYTPQEITAFLVQEALSPLAEPIVAGCADGSRTPDDLLTLNICDPAMGSGAFLIQACRYLAEAYGRARIAAGADEDGRMSQAEFARYKRRVAETCLYGVDLNPMAVELAKVSLWLETLALDRPLTFLDAHLRCGNSLIGAPLRDAEGAFTVSRISAIPDEALKEVSKEATRDQKQAAQERIKRNRAELKRLQPVKAGQMALPGDWGVVFLQQIERALTDTLSRRLDLEQSDEALTLPDAVKLVHDKEQRFRTLLYGAGSRYRQVRQVCDVWCAAWFWPEAGTPVSVRYWDADGSEHHDTLPAPEPPTTQVLLELAGNILGTDPGSLSDEERRAYLATTRSVWMQQRFFHWELEFPEIRRARDGTPQQRGGFDAVVGNPPWETVKPNSQEFWSNYNPLFRELGKQDALRFAEELRADGEIDAEWRAYERAINQLGQYLRKGEQYQHQGGGDINTYKLFLEQSYHLLRGGGGLGMVLPSGLYTDLG